MLSRSRLLGVLTFVLLAGFLAGLGQLFALRLEHGDVYPPYSTLRSDPLGAKVLFQALSELPGLDVRRNYRPISQLNVPGGTLLYAGTPYLATWGEDELEAVEALVRREKVRLVITFLPLERSEIKADEERAVRAKDREKERAKKDAAEGKSPEEKAVPDSSVIPFAAVAKRWGFAFEALQASKSERTALRANSEQILEPKISWHSALGFALKDPAWKAIYRCQGQPVLIERTYGKGTLVLAADSFFLGNEALRNERHPQLLSWLIGPGRAVVFDEESHGISEHPGIASLIEKYGLQGAVAGLLVLGLLFIWKSANPLVPALVEESEAEAVTGRRAEEGLVNLLSRSIPEREIVGTCVHEWEKAFGRSEPEQAPVKGERNPIAAYQARLKARARKPVFRL